MKTKSFQELLEKRLSKEEIADIKAQAALEAKYLRSLQDMVSKTIDNYWKKNKMICLAAIMATQLNGTVGVQALPITDRSLISQAIANQDVEVLKARLKTATTLSEQDKSFLIAKADNIVQYRERHARVSSETKKSILAVACVGSAGLALPCLGNLMFLLGMPPKNYTYSLQEKKLGALFCVGAALAATVSFLIGKECTDGYYTNRPEYIRNYLCQQFNMGYTRVTSTTPLRRIGRGNFTPVEIA